MNITTKELELLCVEYFDSRKNIIAPNISWGLGFKHELDLLILTKNNYVYEVELKISKQDLKRDLLKTHKHKSNKITRLYYAIPESFESLALDILPKHTGILIAKQISYYKKIIEIRKPIRQKARKLNAEELNILCRLIHIRYWKQKYTNFNLYNKYLDLKKRYNEKI